MTDPEPYLIFANRGDIRRVDMTGKDYRLVVRSPGGATATAVDFHWAQGRVVWADVGAVRSARLTDGGDVRLLASGPPGSRLGGLAVDWTGRLYWTDAGAARIYVSRLDGAHRKTLIWRDLHKPRALVVHPLIAAMFWSDWGASPRIERAAMDGSGRRAIVSSRLAWPNGLAIDLPAERLYWADAKHHIIESAGLDGQNRRRVLDSGTSLSLDVSFRSEEFGIE
ncbi:LRP6 [Cordylochernes scorpioides]|uniref:LRP6 n=1 Tax=Cordylochernes scorpioides TaxID=51811 RepID=A0ABY6L323_9ARAC|nr:LRP6 [Cordylochernes scorpioides]